MSISIPPKPPQTVADIEELEAYLKELTTFGKPPGLSLSVVKKNNIVYSGAFGAAGGPNHIPATPETIYHWWSLTKIFTAVAILQLHEQGKLDIDEPVITYLPFFQVKYPSENRQTVTIRHLLNHSSGVPNNPIRVMGWVHLEHEPAWNQTELIKTVLPDYTQLKFEPGTTAKYTNIGYMVLGAIIETVSDQTYENYVLQHLLHPLKMNYTNFVYTPQMLSNAAVGSHPLLRLENLLFPFLVKNMPACIREIRGGKIWFNRLYNDQTPPSGLIGPVTDLARFIAAYLNDGELEGTRIFLPKTIAMMTNDNHVRTKSGQVRGLGWVVSPKTPSRPYRYLQHGGEGPGFASTMRIYPERSLGLAVIANDAIYDRNIILDLAASLY